LFVADSPVEAVKVTEGVNLLQDLTLVNDDRVTERVEWDPDGIVHVLPGGDAVISIPARLKMPATIENTPVRRSIRSRVSQPRVGDRSGTGGGGIIGHGVLEYRDVIGSVHYAKSRIDTKDMKTALYSRCLGGNSTVVGTRHWNGAARSVAAATSIYRR
jgi:hypothetical protein